LIKHSERFEAIPLSGGDWLFGRITKQFGSAIYQTVSVAVKAQPDVICPGRSPGPSLTAATAPQIEHHAVAWRRQVKAITVNVDDDR
jgi:hypothetical protein